jgi:hypothetical protein
VPKFSHLGDSPKEKNLTVKVVFKGCENGAWQRFRVRAVGRQGERLAALLGAILTKVERTVIFFIYFQFFANERLHDCKVGFRLEVL